MEEGGNGEERGGSPQPTPAFLGLSPSCLLWLLSDVFLEAVRVVLGQSPELRSFRSVQILLNYLPLERASWTSILAKQR